MSWRGLSPWTPSSEDPCSFLCSCWAVQKGDVYLSQGGVGEDGGPGSMADSAGKSTAPLAAAWEAPVVWWAVCEGTEVSWLICRWARAAVCQEERALGTATAIIPWCAGALFGALPSLSEVSWSSCCPRSCGGCSVSTSDLCWTLRGYNRQPVLCLKNIVWVVLGFLCTLMCS